ncbi:M28 family peptidase [Brachybacterium sp. GPGPB12]|uniref:M28 family peptidase n=1 Tax=Brachybacterium sp. GPGPB12 TaxID=3023517 RepID=UPI0031345969
MRSSRAPVVVLNHEARGISGRPLVARTAGPMHETLPAMPRPEYESFTDALFGVIPNDTDFTVYRDEGGWWGLDVALIGEAWAYHSPQDDAEHLDPGSLQHFGELTLSLTRELGAQDLAALEGTGEDRPVQTTMPWGILVTPPWLVQGLGLAAPLALAATAAVVPTRTAHPARHLLRRAPRPARDRPRGRRRIRTVERHRGREPRHPLADDEGAGGGGALPRRGAARRRHGDGGGLVARPPPHRSGRSAGRDGDARAAAHRRGRRALAGLRELHGAPGRCGGHRHPARHAASPGPLARGEGDRPACRRDGSWAPRSMRSASSGSPPRPERSPRPPHWPSPPPRRC